MSEEIWNVRSLKELSDEREQHHRELREADQRAVDVALAAQKEAVQVALQVVKEQRNEDKRATDIRFENANEFRGQLKDQASGFITRLEFEQSQRNQTGDRFNGRTDIRGTVTMIAALGAIALTIILNLIR